jgi:hypothetical protein
MVKNIHLHLDEEFFFKLSEDKARREKGLNKFLTWEIYIALLFGLAKANDRR